MQTAQVEQQNQKARKPRMVVLGAALVIASALLIGYHLWTAQRLSGSATLAFYSDDQGRTWFTDSVYRFPPYDHNGKQAVRAFVFNAADGSKFVGFLARFNEPARKMLQSKYEQLQKSGGSMQPLAMLMMQDSVRVGGTEARLPGPGHKWAPFNQLKMNEVKSPTGSSPTGLVSP